MSGKWKDFKKKKENKYLLICFDKLGKYLQRKMNILKNIKTKKSTTYIKHLKK